MTSTSPEDNPQPREGLIDTAVRFLTNPNIVDRPFEQKQAFLKSKGMTADEIRISCERANAVAPVPVPQHLPQSSVTPLQTFPQYSTTSQQISVWIRLRDILHTLALLGGFGYAVYWVYKTYIEPFLFGRPKPKKSTAESLSSIEEAVSNVSRSTNELRAEMRSELSRITQERETGAARSLADIKSDIATVKGLLLSRQQFPSAPNTTTLRGGQNTKTSIPAWQMSAEQKNGLKDTEEIGNIKDSPDDEHNGVDASNSKNSSLQNTTDQDPSNGSKRSKENHVDGVVLNGTDSSVQMASD